MPKNTSLHSEPKFTKGEKCIISHLILTVLAILILVIIYAIHLYMVTHTHGIFSTRRQSLDTKRTNGFESHLVGYLYLNMTVSKFICNTLLLKPRWSLCTAHCVAVRTDPDMANLLFAWGLKYKLITKDNTGQQTSIFDTTVTRSIAHSLFNRETFANNIGLLQHTESYPNLIPNLNNAVLSSKGDTINKLYVVGWNHSDMEITENHNIESISYDAHLISNENCLVVLSPVTTVRNYEFCVTLQKRRQMILDYGAVVFVNLKVVGFFSWGERLQKELPMVMLNITFFQDWLKINGIL